MIWQNPWAWLGLATLAIPVIIHLLGRRSARAQRFPSLRFLDASPLMATRRTRLTDLPLLAVRLGILFAAVAALAAPLVLTANRERALGAALARAIIVDTSESMRRAVRGAPPDGSALDAARREAARLAGAASASVILQTAEPAAAVAGASAWLTARHGRHELVIISDFQVGTLDSTDLAVVMPTIGIELTRIDAVAVDDTALRTAPPAGQNATGAANGLTILAGATEQSRAEAASRAAVVLGGSSAVPAKRPVAIVHRGFETRAQLTSAAQPITQPWQGDVLVRLRSDPTLIAAALDADAASSADIARADNADSEPDAAAKFVTVARTVAGAPVVTAASDRIDGSDRLLLFVRTDAASLTAAALVAAVSRAASLPSRVSERESAATTDSVLAQWRRPASSVTSTQGDDDAGASDGRWLWALALALLGVETWMRRGRRAVKPAEVARERAA